MWIVVIASGYKVFRWLEKEHAQMGKAYGVLINSDIYTPRPSIIFKALFFMFGATGLATFGSGIVDVRRSRRQK